LKRPFAALQKIGNKGSPPTFAADATRQKWVMTLSVCFLMTRPFSLQVQRMSANRPLVSIDMSGSLRSFDAKLTCCGAARHGGPLLSNVNGPRSLVLNDLQAHCSTD
jgi:hypothetical protein